MCLALPGRIMHIDGALGRIDFGGIERTVCLDLLPDVGVGEYIIVHAGFAIQRMNPSEAAEVLSLLEEVNASAREQVL